MAISRGFSGEDLNGARLPGSVDALVSRLDQELYAIWNSASTSTIKRRVEVGLDGTKKCITGVKARIATLSCLRSRACLTGNSFANLEKFSENFQGNKK